MAVKVAFLLQKLLIFQTVMGTLSRMSCEREEGVEA